MSVVRQQVYVLLELQARQPDVHAETRAVEFKTTADRIAKHCNFYTAGPPFALTEATIPIKQRGDVRHAWS